VRTAENPLQVNFAEFLFWDLGGLRLSMAYAYPQTTRTGQWACPTTESQTLPIRARRTLPRPLLPITISLFMVSDGTYDWVVYEKGKLRFIVLENV
jgi:hypothetical protein